jgi:hypothetical protein
MPDPAATTTPRRVVLIHLGRAHGMGTWKRIDGLRAIFEGVGAEVEEILLRVDHKPSLRDLRHPGFADLFRGRLVPEAWAWSHESVHQRLVELQPDVVLCCTSRAYHPHLSDGPWTVVLDFIDRLSVSYGDRATVKDIGAKRWLFRALVWPHARFETATLPPEMVAIAAGWSDARDLGATWVPITMQVPDRPAILDPQHDLLFFGNLGYPPNVEAVARLDRLWPAIVRRRPGTTLLIAGANPGAVVTAAVGRHDGWRLQADFPDVVDLLASARLGVVPLEHASGIQIKVLETAAFGLAQVLSPASRAGLGPGFPAEVAEDDAAMVERIVELLDDEPRRLELGAAERQHITEHYTSTAYEPWARALLALPDPT